MDVLQSLSEWASLIVLGIQGLFAWCIWSLSKKFTTRDDCTSRHTKDGESFKSVDKALTAAEHRQTELEARLDNLPPLDAVHGIRLSMAELRGEFRTQGAEIRGLRDILTRLENQVTLLVRGHMEQ